MATRADFIEFVREQVAGACDLTFRRMFGEYAAYLDGKVVALVCDNQFYLKPTAAGRRLLGPVTEAPPYPGAKLYLRLDAVLEDPEQLALVLRATAAELPVPGPKARPKPKAKARSKPKPGPKPKPKPKPKP